MPRPRLYKNRCLPPNLYLKANGCYRWRNPIDGKSYGLGTMRVAAISQAIEANIKVTADTSVRLVDRLTGEAERTVEHWCVEWLKTHPRARVGPLRKHLGHKVLAKLTPLDIATYLKTWADKPNMRKAMLSTAKTVLGAAVGEGWTETNPALVINKVPVAKSTRERLTLESFLAIRAKADPMLVQFMNLAVVTAQRRGDVVTMKFSEAKEGFLWVTQSKKKNSDPSNASKIRVPLALTLKALDLSVGGVISACRDNVVSQFVLHHRQHNGKTKPGHPFSPKGMEAKFKEARETAGYTGKNPPTIHEIRSLAERLYDAEGIKTQTLLGHKSAASTAIYHDVRGQLWETVAI